MEISLVEFHEQLSAFANEAELSGLKPKDRYSLFKGFDPYSEQIPPALLNAGHAASYALACGMIEPFDLDALVKPATYLVPVEGECRYVDEKGQTQRFYLSKDPQAREQHLNVQDHVRLAPNSVCFVTLAPEFRLPAYIGARFNLLIRDVYRGLLVGTGPMVDPGFCGRLSVPIHNFTNNEYSVEAGEGLVYFEFNKLSWTNPDAGLGNFDWLPTPINDQPPFPASKGKRKGLDDYLTLATGGGPPQSSIGAAMAEMHKETQRAKRLEKIITIGGIIAAVPLLWSVWSLFSDAHQYVAGAQSEAIEYRLQIDERLDSIEQRQDDLEEPISEIATETEMSEGPEG